MSGAAALTTQLKTLLEGSPEDSPPQLAHVLQVAKEFVEECAGSDEPEVLIFQLEDELQTIHHELVDHQVTWPTEAFLTTLHALCPVLSSTSIISTWWDLVLRPALRQPELAADAVQCAKDLALYALMNVDSRHPEKVGEFRRRLLDFYLLDAFNESSGDDLLEWAELDEPSREKRSRWKYNLEHILMSFGKGKPEELMTEINDSFKTPSSRLQLLMLLNDFTSDPLFPPQAAMLAQHPLISSLLTSILLDNSSTVCSIAVTVVTKVLPLFAVEAPAELKRLLPDLLCALARIVCWRERTTVPYHPAVLDGDVLEPLADDELDVVGARTLEVRSDFGWERLEQTFGTTSSSVPCARPFYTILYYLFPCNVLKFLRGPVSYLETYGGESPYTVSWADALDEAQIRSKIESLLRGHITHPLIVWRDADVELTEPDFWTKYDVARISTESAMLDIRNAMLAVRSRHPELVHRSRANEASAPPVQEDAGRQSPVSIHLIDLHRAPDHPVISLADMINTSIALKSNLDVEIVKPTSSWPSVLFPTAASSPSKHSLALPAESSAVAETLRDDVPSHVTQVLSSLQREVLLLKNELNFELYLSRENVKHIGRLYQDRILSKNAEVERQALYNTFRKYKAQVQGLERELREHKEQASSAKNKYADWNTELQKKLREFREEKKKWITEAAALRSKEKEAQARFEAQGKLLAEASKEMFQLQTQKKENQHKIDRLRDYEKQIEQHIKMQRLWDEDFRKFNERAAAMEAMSSEYRKMQLRLESYEKTHLEMDEGARAYRRQIQALEAQLTLAKRSEDKRRSPTTVIESFVAEKAVLKKSNNELREKHAEIQEEVEELRAMVELLKGQITGRRGLVSEPRSSPLLSPSMSPVIPAQLG